MKIILVGIFIALGLFYYMNNRRRIRNQITRERNQERFENLINLVRREQQTNENDKS